MDLCWMAPDDYYWDDLEVQAGLMAVSFLAHFHHLYLMRMVAPLHLSLHTSYRIHTFYKHLDLNLDAQLYQANF